MKALKANALFICLAALVLPAPAKDQDATPGSAPAALAKAPVYRNLGPARQNGRPVKIYFTIQVDFTLN